MTRITLLAYNWLCKRESGCQLAIADAFRKNHCPVSLWELSSVCWVLRNHIYTWRIDDKKAEERLELPSGWTQYDMYSSTDKTVENESHDAMKTFITQTYTLSVNVL